MAYLVLGLFLMLGSHMLPGARSFRATMVSKIGVMGYRGLFSIVSLAGLVLIIWGYAMARQDPAALYSPPFWLRHVTLLLMLFSIIFIVAAYLPGKIRVALKHPMLIGVKTWAVAHLLANGTLADVTLFGSFLAWAVFEVISLKKRAKIEGTRPPAKGSIGNDIIAIAIGFGLYVAIMVKLHEWLIGVAPVA